MERFDIIIRLLPVLFLSIFASCSRPAGTPREAVIRDAEGQAFLVNCLREKGPNAIDQCQTTVRGVGGSSAAHFSHGGGTSGNAAGPLYWNLPAFNEYQICSYLFGPWGVYYCFQLFGFQPQPQPPEGGWCDPWGYDPVYYFRFPRHCWHDTPSPARGKLLEIRKRKILTVTNKRPESHSLFIDYDGNLYREYCSEAKTGPVVLPAPCDRTYVARLSRGTVDQIHLYIDRARNGEIVTITPEIQCFAAPSEELEYLADNEAFELRNDTRPCGSVTYNDTFEARALVNYLDRLQRRYGMGDLIPVD